MRTEDLVRGGFGYFVVVAAKPLVLSRGPDEAGVMARFEVAMVIDDCV